MCWRPRCTDSDAYQLTEQIVTEYNQTLPKRNEMEAKKEASTAKEKEHGLRLRVTNNKDLFLAASRQFQTTNADEVNDASGFLL